jgi:Cu(I)/Ag(I) efflux system membrane fusion protein
MREIELGAALGNSYVVESGLNEGEEIVTQGAFNVDAASQLEGKSSMMNGDVNQAEYNHQSTSTLQSIKKETFEVSGNCESCKERIEKAALAVSGVKSAVWTIDTKMLDISYNEGSTTLETVRKAIAKAGHDNGVYKSDNETYNHLPDCCKYR